MPNDTTNAATGVSPANLKRYVDEILAGLPNEQTELHCAIENQAWFDLDAERYIPQREAETAFDYAGRSKREAGITREVIDILCEHLYSPGPTRTFDNAAGQEFLDKVYTDNIFDALMQEADELATLNDVAAIQVDAGAGVFAEKPITLHLWGRDQFVAWTSPNDARRVEAVCTIDRYDLTTTYKLWTDTEVLVFETKKAEGTAGGRVAEFKYSLKHDYGTLPFEFVHYRLPARRFRTPGLGTFVRRADVRCADRLSRLDESINKHLNPLPIAENVPIDWSPIVEPQRFIRVKGAGVQIGSSGGYEGTPAAKLYYLQATIDVAGAWDDLVKYLNQIFEACRVPLTAVRLEQSGTASGIAIIAEQAPLLTRARKRRLPFTVYETCIARKILTCAGNHYGKPALLEAAATGKLSLGWGEINVPIRSADLDELDKNDLELGLKSRTQLIMQRYGCDRPAAREILKQIKEDRDEEDKIDPAPGQTVDQKTPAEKDPETDQGGKEQRTDDTDEPDDTEEE
jgi:hypothetical protein